MLPPSWRQLTLPPLLTDAQLLKCTRRALACRSPPALLIVQFKYLVASMLPTVPNSFRRPAKHLDLAYRNRERNKWDLYPANDPKAPCFVHIHGGYWQDGCSLTSTVRICRRSALCAPLLLRSACAAGEGCVPRCASDHRALRCATCRNPHR